VVQRHAKQDEALSSNPKRKLKEKSQTVNILGFSDYTSL
jgi:hypothetical protein